MLYALIGDIQTEIADLKITRAIGAVGSYTFTAPSYRFPDPNADFQNVRYSIYFKGITILTEGLLENGSLVIGETGIVDTLQFKGTDEMGLLLIYGGKSNASYLDEKLLFLIDDLLLRVGDWNLGYTLGINATDTFTVDLRQRETLFAQLKAVTDLVPDVYIKYGGKVDDTHFLDAGPLGIASGVQFIQGVNCEPFKRLPRSTKRLYEIEAFGGTSDIRELFLRDAYDNDPTYYTDHPRFPIVETADGTWVVRDLENPLGDRINKYFKEVKVVYPPDPIDVLDPPNTRPWTEEEKEAFHVEAGPALWQACVSQFLKANTQIDNYETTAYVPLSLIAESTGEMASTDFISNELLDFITNELGQSLYTNEEISKVYARINELYRQSIMSITPGETAYLSGLSRQFLFSRQTGDYIWQDILRIEGDYLLSDVNFEFTKDQIIKIYIKTGIQNYETLFEDEQFLAKRSEAKSDILGVGYVTPVSLGVELLSDTQSGVTPDALLSDGTEAKLFSLNTPSIPIGTTQLRFSYYANRANTTIEVLQEPSLAPANFICRATFEGDWDTTKDLTIYGVFIFR